MLNQLRWAKIYGKWTVIEDFGDGTFLRIGSYETCSPSDFEEKFKYGEVIERPEEDCPQFEIARKSIIGCPSCGNPTFDKTALSQFRCKTCGNFFIIN